MKTTLVLAGAFAVCVVLTSISARHIKADPHPAPGAAQVARASNASGMGAAGSENAHRVAAGSGSRVGVAKTYGSLPLTLEPNQGQTNKQVKFLSRGRGYALFLTSHEAVLALRNGKSSVVGGQMLHTTDRNSRLTDVLRMKLLGSNPDPVLIGLDELPGKSNYLIGKNPGNWRTNVPNFAKVAERGVYPGIDLLYYGNQHQLEYDFVVSPGADPRAIRLAIGGARGLRIDSSGNLIVLLEGGELRLHKPLIYQTEGADKQAVSGRFLVRGNHEVAFEVGNYDSSRALVIDPILSYSTYLGGSDIDGANGIAVAPDGTAFITGGTFSSDFPTAHALQPNAGGPNDFPKDAFVAKISADGSTLLYSTYLGGGSTDVANGIAVDSLGNAFVTGTTFSPDFPVTPGAQNTLCGGDGRCGASWNSNGLIVSNAFVTKLNVAGSGLVYSSYLGYYENVTGLAIALDHDDNAYVTGQTGPNITPTVTITPPNAPPPPFPLFGAFQSVFGGDTDCYLTKVSATGSTIHYSTYLGGAGEDTCYGIAVDSGGNAYLTGLTYSGNLPKTVTAPQTVYQGVGDAFLTKVNTNSFGAASLVYSSYLGGNGLDQGNGVALDSAGNAYVTGITKSTGPSFPVTAGALQKTCALDVLGVCEGDAFVTKMNPGGTALIYSTYLGGTKAEAGMGIAVDPSGNAYVTGSTVSTDFPTAGVVFQPDFGGGNADAFVTELNAAGSALVYSTYLGGTNTDLAASVALNTSNTGSCVVSGGQTVCDTFVAGQTCSLDFPVANPLQDNAGGNCDAFVSKITLLPGIAFNPSSVIFPTQGVGTTSAPQTITLTNGDAAQTITSITITGTNSGDFSETNTCGSTLAPGTQCTIMVTFAPTGSGTRKASVTIADSAPNSPQVVSLSGSTSTSGGSGDFTVSASPASASVFAGTSASFTLTIAPSSGFNSAVSLSCSGAPALSTCSIAPASVTPDGIHPATATVTVSTTARTMSPPGPNYNLPDFRGPIPIVWFMVMAMMGILALLTAIRRRAWMAFGIVTILVLLWAGCGGGQSLNPVQGTPAGTYTLSLTGTSGAATHSTSVVLNVN